jgi:hypothetical protein
MKDFNIAKFLKENHLGPHGILGKYVDLHALKEESEEQLDTEVPYKGPDPKLDGFGDKFDQAQTVSEDNGMDTIDSLVAEYDAWLTQNGLPKISADELLADYTVEKTPEQKAWLMTFIDRWEEASDREVTDFVNMEKPDLSDLFELEKPELIYSNDWINDSVDGKKVGKWTCYYEDHMGVLYWLNDDILSEDVTVYATPNWDDAKGIAVEVQVNYGEQILDHATIGDPSYPDFDSYAKDMAPMLQKIEDKYWEGGYDEFIDGRKYGEEDMEESAINEDEENAVATIDLDMGWDSSNPEEDAAAHAAFDKYGIEVEPIDGNPGTFEVTGRKEDILAYLRSEFYDMDEESIAQYYPELLGGEANDSNL